LGNSGVKTPTGLESRLTKSGGVYGRLMKGVYLGTEKEGKICLVRKMKKNSRRLGSTGGPLEPEKREKKAACLMGRWVSWTQRRN